MKKALLIVSGTLLIIFGLFVPLMTTVVTFLLPETFASTARIAPSSGTPAALATEVQKIQSHAVLDQVIADLKLGEEWAKKYRQPVALPAARQFLPQANLAPRFGDETNLFEPGLLRGGHRFGNTFVTYGLVAANVQIGLRVFRSTGFQQIRQS